MKLLQTKVKLLYTDSKMPLMTSQFNAGYDLSVHRIEDYDSYVKVYFGIAIEPDNETYFMAIPRSSIYKRGLILSNGIGVIDNNYRGEITGIFYKTKEFKNDILPGERLIQLVPQTFLRSEFIQENELSNTDRNKNGFGSTGK